eukprot:9027597-Heterocapsa_arctica.AAC.1
MSIHSYTKRSQLTKRRKRSTKRRKRIASNPFTNHPLVRPWIAWQASCTRNTGKTSQGSGRLD